MLATFGFVALQGLLTKYDSSEVALELEQRSKLPSMVASGRYSAFELESGAQKIDDFVYNSFKDGFSFQRSDMAMLRNICLPDSSLGILKSLVASSSKATATLESVPLDSVKSEAIVFTSTKGKFIDLKSIGQLPLEKRIEVAPYFLGNNKPAFFVTMASKDGIGGLPFAKALANSLGGSLKIEPKVLKIGFDATGWRNGFRTVMNSAKKGIAEGKSFSPSGYNPEETGNFEYRPERPSRSLTKEHRLLALQVLDETISSMSPNLIEQTFAYPSTITRLNLNTFSTLKPAVGRYLRAVEPKSEPGASVGGRNNRPLPRNLVSRISPTRPGMLIIETNFRVSLELNLIPEAPETKRGEVASAQLEQVTIQIL